MDRKKYFEKYDSRLVKEGVLKSLVCGAAVGFAANFVAAFVCWCIPDMTWGLWLALGVLAVFTLAAGAIFYFIRFRPTVERSAKRLDSLGLEERLVTMVAYESDESVIANLQREDAKANLNKLDVKAIKFAVSRMSIILASVAAFVGLSMTTVTALKDFGLLPSLEGFIEEITPPEPDVYFTVSYIVGEGGYLEGAEEDQVVLKGTDTERILAVADDGYMFYCWSDGVKAISRIDVNVQENLVIEAIFMPLGEDGSPQDGEGEPGDKPSDKPGEEQGEDPSDDQNSTAGGRYEDHNQIIDARTYYGDKFGEAYETMSEMLANNADMPAELKEMVKTYFDIIKVESDEENPWAKPEEEEEMP